MTTETQPATTTQLYELYIKATQEEVRDASV
jgi:hypothetical protein